MMVESADAITVGAGTPLAGSPVSRLQADPGLAERTAIVVDPSLTSAELDFRLLPADADVFRYGTFSAESEYRFGRKVVAWFPGDHATATEIAREMLPGNYEIDNIIIDSTRSKLTVDDARRTGVPALCDSSWLVAAHPEIARLFMREVRPSAAVRMAAVAAALGYGTVLLAARIATSPITRAKFIKRNQSTMTEPQDSRTVRRGVWETSDADVAVLRAVETALPHTQVLDALRGNPLRTFLTPAPAVAGVRMAPAPKYPGGHDHLFAELPLGPCGSTLRCAYVTLCDSPEYLWGVRALANSLAQVSDIPLILMVPPGFDPGGVVFDGGNVRLWRVNSIRNPHQPKDHQLRFANTFTKLEVFGLSFLDRAVFIDADTLVLSDVDELFEISEFSAAADIGLRLDSHVFNSGVFVCSPNTDIYLDIIEAIPELPSYDGGDQGFLNRFIPEPRPLPPEYNTLRRALGRFPHVTTRAEAKIVHFVGPKPWEIIGEPEWSNLDDVWFSYLSERERIEFVVYVRTLAAHVLSQRPGTGSQRKAGSGAAKKAGRGKSFERARASLDNGHPGKAVKIAKGALRDNPASVANRRVLADALAVQGKTREAFKVRAKTLGMRAGRSFTNRLARKPAKKEDR